MDVWHLLLYAMASLLALRSLMSLMTVHRQQFQQQLAVAEQEKRRKKRRTRSGEKLDGPDNRGDAAA
jgi:hypothetical protein